MPAFQALTKGGGIGVGEGVAVEDDGGGKAAGTDAARGGEGSVGVESGFAGLNAQGLFCGGKESRRAFDVTGRAHADEAAMLARRLEGE